MPSGSIIQILTILAGQVITLLVLERFLTGIQIRSLWSAIGAAIMAPPSWSHHRGAAIAYSIAQAALWWVFIEFRRWLAPEAPRARANPTVKVRRINRIKIFIDTFLDISPRTSLRAIERNALCFAGEAILPLVGHQVQGFFFPFKGRNKPRLLAKNNSMWLKKPCTFL